VSHHVYTLTNSLPFFIFIFTFLHTHTHTNILVLYTHAYSARRGKRGDLKYVVSQGSIDGLRHVLRALEGYAAGTRAGGAAFAFEVRPSLPPSLPSFSLFLSFSLSLFLPL
jgi:hypothetical protein